MSELFDEGDDQYRVVKKGKTLEEYLEEARLEHDGYTEDQLLHIARTRYYGEQEGMDSYTAEQASDFFEFISSSMAQFLAS